jgi:hypothetical protein
VLPARSDRPETEDALIARAKTLHQGDAALQARATSNDYPSRFRT